MYRFALVGKLTVLSLLIFANSLFLFSQSDSIYKLPAGTRIRLTPDIEIASSVASVNDTFLVTVVQPVKIREVVMLPVGTVIEGRVAAVERASVGGQGGKLDLVFETIKISNQTRRIDGVVLTPIKAESGKLFNILSIVGGAAIGAAIGSASNKDNGPLIGAALGGGAGTGLALIRKGKEVRIRKGDEFEIELKKDVLLPVLDY